MVKLNRVSVQWRTEKNLFPIECAHSVVLGLFLRPRACVIPLDFAGCIAQNQAICTRQSLELLGNPDRLAGFA